MSKVVLDGSMALSWVLADEKTDQSEAVRKIIEEGAEVRVPSLWPLEVANALLVAERRKRISQTDTTSALAALAKLPVEIDSETGQRAGRDIIALARQHSLSVYDAACLELVVRQSAALASLDEALRKAAEKLKVPLLPETL
jgi:predicted nucleic acid-binding protein